MINKQNSVLFMTYLANPNRYSEMEYRFCGKSGLKLPVLSLGLWHNFGHSDNYAEAKTMLRTAFDQGITHFDLANNYGTPAGSAEENFGRILKSTFKPYRDEMIIATKAGYDMWDGPYGDGGSKKYLVASLNQSLRRMGLDYVDIFYSHRYDPETPLEETADALELIYKQGKALYIAISNYGAEQTEKMHQLLEHRNVPCLANQSQYSMLNRGIENGLAPECSKRGIGLITFQPLSQGILSNKYLNGIPQGSRAERADGFLQSSSITDELIEKVKKLNQIAEQREQSLAQMAIVWCLAKLNISSVLIGASSNDQLLQNLQSLKNANFTESELAEIDQIIK